jgi:predicted nucleic acid-binding Zn finger protein
MWTSILNTLILQLCSEACTSRFQYPGRIKTGLISLFLQVVLNSIIKVDLLCDGSGFCTCPSFTEVQSKKNRPCKHIVALDMHIVKKGVRV